MTHNDLVEVPFCLLATRVLSDSSLPVLNQQHHITCACTETPVPRLNAAGGEEVEDRKILVLCYLRLTNNCVLEIYK
jgi:hypothetical protein